MLEFNCPSFCFSRHLIFLDFQQFVLSSCIAENGLTKLEWVLFATADNTFVSLTVVGRNHASRWSQRGKWCHYYVLPVELTQALRDGIGNLYF